MKNSTRRRLEDTENDFQEFKMKRWRQKANNRHECCNKGSHGS
jgi:hypothetical protein